MSSELAVVYATLILHDDGVAPDAEKLRTLIEAAGIEIEPIWCSLFAKALAGKDVGDFLMNVGSGPAGGGAPAAGGDSAPAAAKEEKKEEVEEVFFELWLMGLCRMSVMMIWASGYSIDLCLSIQVFQLAFFLISIFNFPPIKNSLVVEDILLLHKQ
jgi:large subunit ribosomal protein LP1